ncbi:thymidine phosphorylase [candidate division WOR-3 bacterium]|uniref:Thymidine phosphorylase n=1 Tax=candidate division WOR-3 bacterium TaxID=2052148 RepID=A0A937XFU4_UNCW3|nr:thymidine phosphorylase [candidate division WOR-3 bacterium]
MHLYELIRRKRDGGSLGEEEIEELVACFASGTVPDYQMAAMLMAVFFSGMTAEETAALTLAMMNSGDVFDLSGVPGPKVDKHSTGGVGDKVSLILAPLVAACGVRVPMVSGRSLGHTGGTLDKLESIPGFRTDLSYAQFKKNVSDIGLCIMGQTQRMCPADRKLYALRDVTATVDSVPLIAASIMSKKLAEGIDGLVLDVKTGSGAFMSRTSQARQLARAMISIGTQLGKKVVALVTDMSEPLGEAVGNGVEVIEAIEALKGRWQPDLEEVTLALGEEMLVLAGLAGTLAQARRLLMRALSQGLGLEKFRQMVRAQGGDPKVVDDYGLLPQPACRAGAVAASAGFVRSIDPLRVGLLGVGLGVGRQHLDSRIDHSAGFLFRKKVGEKAAKDEVIAEVAGSNEAAVKEAALRLPALIAIGPTPPRRKDMVLARLIGNGNDNQARRPQVSETDSATYHKRTKTRPARA